MNRRIADVIIKKTYNSLLYKTNKFHVAVCVCSEIDHRRRQNLVKKKVAHEAIAEFVTDVFCDLLLGSLRNENAKKQ